MISDERYHLYCKEVSKNTVNQLQSKKERGRRQILIDRVESKVIHKEQSWSLKSTKMMCSVYRHLTDGTII